MTKSVFLFFQLILFVSISYSQVKNKKNIESNKILWNDSIKLSWDDFKGARKFSKANSVAEIQCAIEIEDIKLVNGLPVIVIKNYFLKNESWTITNEESDLHHEQLHFDIYELYTRMIRKIFIELNNSYITDINEYQKKYDELVQKAMQKNDEYDREVYFNLEKQNEWKLYISSELIKMKEYEFN